MRSCCAVYVDTGYLLASAATRATGTSLRGGVTVDHQRLIQALIAQAESDSQLPLLRVNWYDSGAASGGVADRVQESIGLLPRVKLRLGRLSAYGTQKGVDLKLGLDMVTHARNRVIDLIYLVSGDDDLAEAVEEAQGLGVQVMLMAVPRPDGQPHAISRHLQQEADGLIVIDPSALDAAVTPRPRPTHLGTAASSVPDDSAARPTPADVARMAARRMPATPDNEPQRRQADLVYSSATGMAPVDGLPGMLDGDLEDAVDDVCRGVLATWSTNATTDARTALLHSKPYIPGDIDRALLLDLSARLGSYDIDEPTRFLLRRRFWDQVDAGLRS